MLPALRASPAANAAVSVLALSTSIFVAGLALADLSDPPGGVEATFADTRAKDDLFGVLTVPQAEVRFELAVPASSALSVTLTPDDTAAGAASGVALRLCDPTGADVPVTGTPADRTKAGKDAVKWRGAPLDRFGTYTLSVSAATAGGFRLKLAAQEAQARAVEASADDLPVNGTASVTFSGRSGDVAKIRIAGAKGSKLRGRILRVTRPGGSDIVPEDAGDKLKLVLDEDGEHTVTFQNVGRDEGAWVATTKVAPRAAKKRRGLASAAQTGLVPKVKRVDPSRGVHLDTALAVTITGRDLQPGADVRLERRGRDPIVATDVRVISPTELTCVLDLDTRLRDGGATSVGAWSVAVRNAPVYGDPQDPGTIDRDSVLTDDSKTFTAVASGSVKLPRGVQDDTEVWHIAFQDAFATDLERMGLSSTTVATRDAAREAVQDYVIAYLRDLFLVQETNGNVKGAAVPVSFVLDDVTRLAGEPGVDYNQVLVGGEAPPGAPQDPGEPLPWGFAPFDAGNAQRNVVTVFTDVLDPRGGNPWASASYRQAMQPLRDVGLGRLDLNFFEGRFDPGDKVQADRFAVIVTQIERASREVAAIIAHQIGKAMGLTSPGEGPMAAPSTAGAMWIDRDSLAFGAARLATLRTAAVAHELPGKSDDLKITFFPIIDRQPRFLPDLTTGVPYEARWNLVGGRCNALPGDYRLTLLQGSNSLPGLTLSYNGLAGTAPVCLDGSCQNINAVYCGVAQFTVRIDDTLRGGGSLMPHRLRIIPDINQFPPGHPLRSAVQNCINTVVNTR